MYGTWEAPVGLWAKSCNVAKSDTGTPVGIRRVGRLGESDKVVVPRKPMNKTEKPEAEWVEGRALTKRNSQHDAGARAQNRSSTTSRLLAVRNAAKRDKARQFTSLMHHLTI